MNESLILVIDNLIDRTYLFTSACAIILSVFHSSADAMPQKPTNLSGGRPSKTLFYKCLKILHIVLCWLAGLSAILLAIQKQVRWIYVPLMLTALVVNISIVYQCFFGKEDHDFSTSEFNIFNSLIIYRWTYDKIIEKIFTVSTIETRLQEALQLTRTSLDWFLSLFISFSALYMTINTLGKRINPKPIKYMNYSQHPFFTIDNWFVEQKYKNTFTYFLWFPLLFSLDLIKNIVILFTYRLIWFLQRSLALAYNILVISLFNKQKTKKDTAIIRFVVKFSLILALSLVYFSGVIDENYSKEVMDIFSYIATVLIIPILLDGLMELRKQQKNVQK